MITLNEIRGLGTITVPQAGQVLGIGRDAAYRAAERREIPTLRLGRKLRVPVPALLELLGERVHTDSEAGACTAPATALTSVPAQGDRSHHGPSATIDASSIRALDPS